jgi:hypothetical protein
MSKVQLQGNVSGTGVFTIASPNSNTDRTLTLPDATGTVQVSGNPISGTTGTFSGIIQANGGGIQFPATQVPSADANTLDDYEEGTWTPRTATNVVIENATYTKIGNRVAISCTVIHSGSITSYDRIALPFAPAAATSETRYTGGVQFFEGGTGTAALNIRLLTQQNISPECFFWANSGTELWPFSMAYDGTNGIKQYTFAMTYRV